MALLGRSYTIPIIRKGDPNAAAANNGGPLNTVIVADAPPFPKPSPKTVVIQWIGDPNASAAPNPLSSVVVVDAPAPPTNLAGSRFNPPDVITLKGDPTAAPFSPPTPNPLIVSAQPQLPPRAPVLLAAFPAEINFGVVYQISTQPPLPKTQVLYWIGDPNASAVIGTTTQPSLIVTTQTFPKPASTIIASTPQDPRSYPHQSVIRRYVRDLRIGLGRFIKWIGDPTAAPGPGSAPLIDEPTTLALSVHRNTLALNVHRNTATLNVHSNTLALGVHSNTATLNTHLNTATLNTHSNTASLNVHSTTNVLRLEDL